VDLRLGDCLEVLADLPRDAVIVSDPPYGMAWNTDSTRFTFGGRSDWGKVRGDDRPFDPSPWLGFRKVILWGANHYGARLPVGTTLVWIKKADHLFGTFLSDAEIGWMKGGYGVYCYRKSFPSFCRIKEGGGKVVHPTQKPIGLMEWCIGRLKLEPGTLVVDPYMGSGTTGVAAVRLGFDFVGCEIDPAYYAVARARIDAELNKHPLLEGVS
jgi:DNA modification methylase